MQTKWCQNIEVEIKFCLQSRSFTLLYSECVSPAHKVFFIFYFMPLCSTHYEYGSWTMSYLFYSKRRGFCSYIEVRQQITCIEFSFVSASGNLLEFHNVYELDLHFIMVDYCTYAYWWILIASSWSCWTHVLIHFMPR